MMALSTLPNGLRVASREMGGVETVAVGLYAATGTRHEPEPLNGLAHLFEHMLFKGAGERSAREINEAVEDVGGDLNASTDRETTAFYLSLLAPDLPFGVALLADLVRRPHLAELDLAREKKVIGQELEEARDNPADLVWDLAYLAAFPGQAVGRPVLGDEESLAGIGVDDLRAWLESRYRPDSLLLVASGKVEHARLVDLAEAAFGDMAPGRAEPAGPARYAGGRSVQSRRAAQSHVALTWPAPAALTVGAPAARLFGDIVGGGTSSRLFQRIREELGLAYSVSAGVDALTDAGTLWVYTATATGDVARAVAEIEAALHDAAASADERELARAKALAKAGLLMSLESCWGQASFLARQIALRGRLVEPAEVVAELDAVTLPEVRAAGAAMLAGPRTLACVGKLPRAA